MSKAYHFNCTNCSFAYSGPLGHTHALREQVVSVVCPDCKVIEARSVNWTQILPEAENLSDNIQQLTIEHDRMARKNTTEKHKIFDKMIDAAERRIEIHDYSIQSEDIFTCWTCEGEMLIWDAPVCPCCGGNLQRNFSIDLD